MAEEPKQPKSIGLIVASHGELARTLVEVSEFVLGRETTLRFTLFRDGDDPRRFSQQLKTLVRKANQGRGVIVMVDLFGGTPGSAALALAEEERVEIVTGVNLPMAVAAASLPPDLPLKEACSHIVAAGTEAIKSAGDILTGG